MNNQIFWTWSLGLALAALPLAGGCDQEMAESAPAPVAVAAIETSLDLAAITNAPTAEMAELQLENAPGQIVSLAQPPAATSHLSSPSAEIVKLAQAGVDESVMLSYATNSPNTFNLSSDDIVFLNDIGVPSSVVTAMINHDQSIMGFASTPPVYTNQIVPAPGTPTPYPETAMEETPAYDVSENTEPPDQSNVSYTYFYNSLAPYGNWIDIAGYGRCWQPTVVAVNPGWQPYCDRGRWVYSDCGWYWSSGYSWGWAPFHYGRWFCHSRWGWCWAPDTVWGPSWVTWRYTPGYCGWAPLPPTACFTPGIGLSYHGRPVSVGFGFGLGANRFTFVAANRVFDTHPERYRLPPQSTRHAFNNAVVYNQIMHGRNNSVINEGIPVSHVAAATHTEIRRVHIRDASDPVSTRSEHIERDGSRSVMAYRPNLPQPTHSTVLVGEGVRPAPRTETSVRASRTVGNQATGSRQLFTEANPNARDRRPDTTPTIRNDSSLPTSNDTQPGNSGRTPRTAPTTGRTSPLIMRGPDRSNPSDNDRGTAPAGSVILTGPRDANRVPTLNQLPRTSPTTVTGPAESPVQNTSPRIIVNPNQRQYTPPYQQQAPAPGQNQRDPRVFRSSEPRNPQYPQQDQRVYSQPTPPVQVPQSPPVYTQPRAPEPAPPYRQPTPAPQSPPPAVRSQPSPRVESRPVESRQVESRQVESRPAPRQQQQSAPQARSQDAGSARQAPAAGGGGGGGGGTGRGNR